MMNQSLINTRPQEKERVAWEVEFTDRAIGLSRL